MWTNSLILYTISEKKIFNFDRIENDIIDHDILEEIKESSMSKTEEFVTVKIINSISCRASSYMSQLKRALNLSSSVIRWGAGIHVW